MRRAAFLVVSASCAALTVGTFVMARPALAGGGGCYQEQATEQRGTRVEYSKFCPSPTVLQVKPGQRVTWKNLDPITHTVTSSFGGWADVKLDPGGTFSHTFDAPGSYAYYCMLHPNMGGIIDVATPATAPVAAPQAPKTGSSALSLALLTAGVGVVGTGAGFAAGRRRRKD